VRYGKIILIVIYGVLKWGDRIKFASAGVSQEIKDFVPSRDGIVRAPQTDTPAASAALTERIGKIAALKESGHNNWLKSQRNAGNFVDPAKEEKGSCRQ